MRIAIASLKGLGNTFMEWSLYYLCNLNDGKMYRPDINQWTSVVNNPLLGASNGAHSHHKVHPVWNKSALTKTETPGALINDFIDITKDIEGDILFYPFVAGYDLDTEIYKVNEEMIRYLYDNEVKIITLKPDVLYPYLNERSIPEDDDALMVLRVWLKNQVSSKKKIRELASFRIIGNAKKYIEGAKEYHERINHMTMATISDAGWQSNPEDHMIQICDTLGFEVLPNRLETWRPIAKEWTKGNDNITDWFEIQAPAITSAIVENRKMTLPTLNIWKQITVMAYLMRDHGKRLILPTDNFPLDTQILHGYLK